MQNGYNGGGGGGGGGGNDDDDRKPPWKPNKNSDKKTDWQTPSSSSQNDDIKKRRRRNRGNSTAGDDTCSMSTTSTAVGTAMLLPPMTTTGFATGTPSSSSHCIVELDERRDRLQQQMMMLSATSTTALGVFVVTVLPMAAILAIGLLFASLGLLSFTTYQRLVLEYQQIVAGQGFGRFLPTGLYQQLTEGSLHQFMTQDNDFVREWGFMALYFVPGLTEEQRDQYIRRLAPERQTYLERPGLGYLLGDGFMRALVGDQRWGRHSIENSISRAVHPQQQQQHQPQSQSPPLQITAATAETPTRRLDFDSDGESTASTSPDVLGLTIQAVHGEDHSNNNDNTLGDGNANNSNAAANANDGEDERRHQRQLDEEGDVVLSALFTGIGSYVSWIAEVGGEAAYDFVVDPASSMVSVVGIGAAVLSLGVGAWGASIGFYSRPTMATTSSFSATSLLPSSRVLVSTAILGGVSAGVMLYARSAVRKVVKAPQKPPPRTKK